MPPRAGIVWALATVVGLILVALGIAPYDALLAPAATGAPPQDAARAAQIAAPSAFFTAVGMLLSTFTAAVAGRVGGLQTEHMHPKAR